MARLTLRWLKVLIEFEKGKLMGLDNIWDLDTWIDGAGQDLFSPNDSGRAGFGSVGYGLGVLWLDKGVEFHDWVYLDIYPLDEFDGLLLLHSPFLLC